MSQGFLQALDMSDVVQVDDGSQLFRIAKFLRGRIVGGNMMSEPEKPHALDIISSVMEEQSHPQPYSCRILIRNGFGVAFTAKNSLKPLFHAKASFNACAFSRIPSHHKDEMG